MLELYMYSLLILEKSQLDVQVLEWSLFFFRGMVLFMVERRVVKLVFSFLKGKLFIYLFIYGCVGSLFL